MPQPPRKAPPSSIKPAHVLIICLCVAMALFAGSLIVGWVAWQADKTQGIQTDQPAQ